MDTINCIIPARGGSKGIPLKNIKLFCNMPLIYWSIKAANGVPCISRILLSTDSQDIANVALRFKAEVPYLRPAHLAQDNSTTISVILDMIDRLCLDGHILLIQPTSPLITSDDIKAFLDVYISSNFKPLVSVSKLHTTSPFYLDNTNRINHLVPYTQNQTRQASQDIFTLTGAMYVSTVQQLLQDQSFITNDTRAHILPAEKSVDIDTVLDWEISEFLFAKQYDV